MFVELEIDTAIVSLLVPLLRNVQVKELLWPPLRSKLLEAFPLEMESPELGVIVAVTAELDPPVLEKRRLRVVLEPLERVEVMGLDCSVTVMEPGLFTTRLAFAVCAVTLSPVAVTVIV